MKGNKLQTIIGRGSFARIMMAGTLGCLAGGCHLSGQQGELWTFRPDGQGLTGVTAAAELESRFGGVVADAEIQDRLDRVGQRLMSSVPGWRRSCTFSLLAADEPNAFSLSSGQVYVTAGFYRMLATDDLLAAALAHELAHVEAQDGRKPIATAEEQLERELAADRGAAVYLEAAGYDADALVALLRLVADEQKPGWVRDRIEALGGELICLHIDHQGRP